MSPLLALKAVKTTTLDKIKAFVAWVKEQLYDPTSGMHGMAFVTIGYELFRSWHTKTPLDMQKIYTAFALFGGGFVGDRFIPAAQTLENKGK